jgi:S-adenosylmethionine decarboxylase
MADSATRFAGVSEIWHEPTHEMNSNTTYFDSVCRVDADGQQSAMAVAEVVDFVERDGAVFAGTHLLIEFWQAENLTDVPAVEAALVEAAKAAKATVLHSYLHPFGPELGVSGVVVLAESHISIHTWPEQGYAAIDVFMCGECDPGDTIPVLRQAFAPRRMSVSEHRRGLID